MVGVRKGSAGGGGGGVEPQSILSQFHRVIWHRESGFNYYGVGKMTSKMAPIDHMPPAFCPAPLPALPLCPPSLLSFDLPRRHAGHWQGLPDIYHNYELDFSTLVASPAESREPQYPRQAQSLHRARTMKLTR